LERRYARRMRKPRFELSTVCGTICADGACQRSRQHRGAPAPSLSYSQMSVATRCTATTSCPSPPAAIRTVLRSGFATVTTRASRCSLVACSTGSAARTSRERTAIQARRSSASAASTDCSRKLVRYLVSFFGMAATFGSGYALRPPRAQAGELGGAPALRCRKTWVFA